jgi:hypothetical protein
VPLGRTLKRKDRNWAGVVVCAAMTAISIVLSSGFEVLANDSTARLGAGGIELTKNEDIRILEEILEISTKKIRVKYRFLNESQKDIHTIVAFPLPLYGAAAFPREGPPVEPDPFKISASFSVLADGSPVSMNVEYKAVLGGRDVTAQLRGLGLSDKQIFNFDLTWDELDALVKLHGPVEGLLEGSSQNWKVAKTVFWQQTFPSGKEILVEHQYQPEVGRNPQLPREDWQGSDLPIAGEDRPEDVCLDDVTKRAIRNRIEAMQTNNRLTSVAYSDVEYILGTGRNWKGPIGRFTLRIKKEAPDELVSLCFPGKPTKISPTVLEFHQKDFVPPDRLVVYFYKFLPY